MILLFKDCPDLKEFVRRDLCLQDPWLQGIYVLEQKATWVYENRITGGLELGANWSLTRDIFYFLKENYPEVLI